MAIHIPFTPKLSNEDRYLARGIRISQRDTKEKTIVGKVSPAPLNIPFATNIREKGI